jgi:hypothetical protein
MMGKAQKLCDYDLCPSLNISDEGTHPHKRQTKVELYKFSVSTNTLIILGIMNERNLGPSPYNTSDRVVNAEVRRQVVWQASVMKMSQFLL